MNAGHSDMLYAASMRLFGHLCLKNRSESADTFFRNIIHQ
jgi:hypothetical protein